MKKVSFDLEERVVSNYELEYDEKKLKELGYSSLKEYCQEKGITPFDIKEEDELIGEIKFKEIIEYLDEHPSFREIYYWEEKDEN